MRGGHIASHFTVSDQGGFPPPPPLRRVPSTSATAMEVHQLESMEEGKLRPQGVKQQPLPGPGYVGPPRIEPVGPSVSQY